MINVTMYCRRCGDDAEAITIASEFEPEKGSEIADTQAHMDKNFVARCGGCESCAWEVIGVEPIFHENWVLNAVQIKTRVPSRTPNGDTVH